MKGSASRPRSVTMNGTRCAIRPDTNAASRESRSSFDPNDDKAQTFSPAWKLDTLSDQQKKESQSRPNAALIHETIKAEGVGELERTAAALLLSGLAAGLSMGFSLVWYRRNSRQIFRPGELGCC
jgi:hypothetical protein